MQTFSELSSVFSSVMALVTLVAPFVFLYRKRTTVKQLVMATFRAWMDTLLLLRERVGLMFHFIAHPCPGTYEALMQHGREKQENRERDAFSLTTRLMLYLTLPFIVSYLSSTLLFRL